MAKAFVLVHEDILSDIQQNIAVKVGEKDDCLDRPLEQVQVGEDEFGNTIYVLVPGDPVTVTRDIMFGHISFIGKIDNVYAIIAGSTLARLQAIKAAAPANQFLVLAVGTKDEDGAYEWSAPVDADDRTRLNTWLTNHGYPTIPEAWSKWTAIKEVYKLFRASFGPDIEGGFDDMET